MNMKEFTADEVAKHNTPKDAWMIIDDKIYDLTDYLDKHPGGPEHLTPFLGKDGTKAFATKADLGIDHSPFAYNLLADYQIGVLKK